MSGHGAGSLMDEGLGALGCSRKGRWVQAAPGSGVRSTHTEARDGV